MRTTFLVCAALASACSKQSAPSAAAVDASAPTAIDSAAPAPVDAGFDAAGARGDRIRAIRTTETLAGSLAICRPAMGNAVYGLDAGGSTEPNEAGRACLAVWASLHMKWSDVAVSKNETSFALVLKDADEAVGKRLCIDARVDLIQAMGKAANLEKMFAVYMRTNDGQFMAQAVRSTGEIVKGSAARFCGVVAGRERGTGMTTGLPVDQVDLVGMFDLPENKADSGP